MCMLSLDLYTGNCAFVPVNFLLPLFAHLSRFFLQELPVLVSFQVYIHVLFMTLLSIH